MRKELLFLKRDFILTTEDYIDFNLFIYNTSPQFKRKRIVQTVAFPIIYLLIPVFLKIYRGTPYSQSYPIFIIAAVLWIIFYPIVTKFGVKKNVKRIVEHSEKNDKKLTGDYSVELESDGVKITNELGNIKMKWENISELKEDDERIYIFLDQVTAYIVKKDAFENKEEENMFKNTVTENVEKTKMI